LPITAEQGYIIPAINTENVDYVQCAKQLADSIRYWHPTANITIITKDQLPNGDLGGFANDWQMFRASPYRQTIKLEADMLITSPIDHWWTMLQHRDLVISTGARDFYNNRTDCRFYRRVFDVNHLPDVYNAVTYWRVSETAQYFFNLVRNIFENWAEFKTLLKYPDDVPTTDLVYAMAAVIIGPEQVTIPCATYPKIVHMKQHIVPTQQSDWTRELVWEYDHGHLRINTVAQHGAFHYHKKTWNPNEQQ
jgi:hypothetical protein